MCLVWGVIHFVGGGGCISESVGVGVSLGWGGVSLRALGGCPQFSASHRQTKTRPGQTCCSSRAFGPVLVATKKMILQNEKHKDKSGIKLGKVEQVLNELMING